MMYFPSYGFLRPADTREGDNKGEVQDSKGRESESKAEPEGVKSASSASKETEEVSLTLHPAFSMILRDLDTGI